MRIREIIKEANLKRLFQDLVDLAEPEFIKLYGKTKAQMQASFAKEPEVQQTLRQYDSKRIPQGWPQPPWDMNTVKAYFRLINRSEAEAASAYQRGWDGPLLKQPNEAVGDNLQAPYAGQSSRFHQMEAQSPALTVCVFKGMSHGTSGNQACEQIAEATGGQVWGPTSEANVGSVVAEASRYYQSRPGTKLVLVGYSMGAKCCLLMQALRPALTVSIAGWYSTVEQLDHQATGDYWNFYQQKELDRYKTRDNKGVYRPSGQHPVEVDLDHSSIVPGVMNKVIGLINAKR